MSKRILVATATMLAALGIAAFVAASAALAAGQHRPAESAVLAPTAGPTPRISATARLTATRPAIAISTYFSTPLTQVVALHDTGWGYGEIFKLYRLSVASSRAVTEVQALRESGLGWGQIAKSLGVHPGNAGVNLGAAMSDRDVLAAVAAPAAQAAPGQRRNDNKVAHANDGNGNDGNGNGGNGNGGNGNGGHKDKDKKKDK